LRHDHISSEKCLLAIMSARVSVVLYVIHMYQCGCHWTDCLEI